MAKSGKEIVPVAGRGLTGFFGFTGLILGGSLASARFGLPLGREFFDLWRHNLQVDPWGGLALLIIGLGAILVALAVFCHLRPLVHILIDRAAGTVSWMAWWRPKRTVRLDQVGPVTVSAKTVKFQNTKSRGQIALHVVKVPSLFDSEVFSFSSVEEAGLRARDLAERLGTKVV